MMETNTIKKSHKGHHHKEKGKEIVLTKETLDQYRRRDPLMLTFLMIPIVIIAFIIGLINIVNK